MTHEKGERIATFDGDGLGGRERCACCGITLRTERYPVEYYPDGPPAEFIERLRASLTPEQREIVDTSELYDEWARVETAVFGAEIAAQAVS